MADSAPIDTSLIPVPEQIQRRAWECAFVLREQFADRLSLEQNIRTEVICRAASDRLGWRECGDAFCLWHAVVSVRV